MQEGAAAAPTNVWRAKALASFKSGDTTFRLMAQLAAATVLLVLGGIIVSLVHGSWPALHEFGFNFLINESWNPVTENFGAIAPIYGTVVTSIIAMLISGRRACSAGPQPLRLLS